MNPEHKTKRLETGKLTDQELSHLSMATLDRLRARIEKMAGVWANEPRYYLRVLLKALGRRGEAPPNFCWDIELYQAVGLLPADYEHPGEAEIEGSVYRLRKALEALLAVAEPIGLALKIEGLPRATSVLTDAVLQAKRALADHGKAGA